MTIAKLKAMGVQLTPAQEAELEQEAKAEKYNLSVKRSKNLDNPDGISVYGLQRFPVTLRAAQWKALFAAQKDVEAYY